MPVTVLDLDGSVTAQPLFADMIARGEARAVDLRALGPKLGLVAGHEAHFQLMTALEPLRAAAGLQVAFHGSGDFHHVTAALLAQHEEPLTVIHFDAHPDWARWPATHGWRTWVSRALELPHVARVITLGPTRGLVRPEFGFANLAALETARLEVYPWRHPPSRVYRWYRDTVPAVYEARHLHWRSIADMDWGAFIEDLIARLPTEAVYITIDKSVLGEGDGDPGAMTAGHLLVALELIAARCRVAGADVCGEAAPRIMADPLRRMLVRFDPPGPAPAAKARAFHEAVNVKILLALGEIHTH